MKKVLLLRGILAALLIAAGGCSVNDNYCCENNDLCVPVNGKNTSCTAGVCGKCIVVDPLQISSISFPGVSTGQLPEVKVGQKDYSAELTATGGLPPYTWKLTHEDETSLAWLTITQEGDDKATLHNYTDTNNDPLYPTIISDGVPLTITLVDSSKHGKDTRDDNQGKTFQMAINIKDCPHKCKRVDDSDDNPTASENETKCENNKLSTCTSTNLSTDSGKCVKWNEGSVCMCQTKGQYANVRCCAGELCTNGATSCKEGYKYTCGVDDGSGCLSPQKGGQCTVTVDTELVLTDCKADSSDCKTCIDTCEPHGSSKCSDTNVLEVDKCKLDTDECYKWFADSCDTDKPCHNGACAGCKGCWDKPGNCQLGTTTDNCGSSGVSCKSCNDPESCSNGECICTGCLDGSKQCQSGTTTSQCGKNAEGCQSCLYGKTCIDKECKCSGCWDVKLQKCQSGTTTNTCGKGDADCVTCQDKPDTDYVVTGCNDGQCSYRYVIQNNGQEVLDTLNNIIWKRQFDSVTYTWEDAKNHCLSLSCRLPTIGELKSIVETGHSNPYINTNVFPGTPSGLFWSSSIDLDMTDYFWGVSFLDGLANGSYKTEKVNCRCACDLP